MTMICEACNRTGIVWEGPLDNPTGTRCPHCGSRNTQRTGEHYTDPNILGEDEGELCNRDGCQGILAFPPVEDCTCFNNPPCGACLDNRPKCPDCGWEADDGD